MQQTINKWFVTCLETVIPLTFLSTRPLYCLRDWSVLKELQFPKLGLQKDQMDIIRKIRKEIIRVSQAALWFINNGFD